MRATSKQSRKDVAPAIARSYDSAMGRATDLRVPMFFVTSKIFEFFLAPVHFAIFVCAVGAALLYTRWRGWGRALATFGALALLLMAFGPLDDFLAVPLGGPLSAPAGRHAGARRDHRARRNGRRAAQRRTRPARAR